jgi:hypothetical protein
VKHNGLNLADSLEMKHKRALENNSLVGIFALLIGKIVNLSHRLGPK